MGGGNDFLSCEVEVGPGEADVVDVQLQLLRRRVDLGITPPEGAQRRLGAQRLQIRTAITGGCDNYEGREGEGAGREGAGAGRGSREREKEII